MFRCMCLGPPWVLWDDWTESVRGLCVTSGLREVFKTSWTEHVVWTDAEDQKTTQAVQGIAPAASQEASGGARRAAADERAAVHVEQEATTP
eukprot:8874551-Pyramimonas_sp.AAC.1